MNWRRLARLILLAVIGAGGYYIGRNIPYADQWPVYDGLRQTAAIVFGITGAWIAIVYPTALGNLLKRKHSRKTEGQAALNRLLAPMIVSTAIMLVVLVAALLAPCVRRAPWLATHPQIVRGLSFAIVTLLTTAEVWAILCTLVPMDNVKRELDNAANKSAIIGEARPRTSDGDEA